MALPMVESMVPKMMRSGPIAATSSPTLMIMALVPSSIPFSLSMNDWIADTILRMAGIMTSPKEMASSCSWLLRMVS